MQFPPDLPNIKSLRAGSPKVWTLPGCPFERGFPAGHTSVAAPALVFGLHTCEGTQAAPWGGPRGEELWPPTSSQTHLSAT